MSFSVEEASSSPSPFLIVCEVLLWLVLFPLRSLIFVFEQVGLWGKFRYPSAEEVLSIGPPRCFLEPDDLLSAKSVTTVDLVKLNENVNKVVQEQLMKRRQLGVSVVAYYRGRIVVHVAAGVHRTACGKPAWLPVTPATRFMIQSVTKSICACGVLALVSQGDLNYDDKVVDLWPEFASEHPSKQSLSIGEVLSHRAGLTCAGGDVPLVIARNLWHVWQGGWHTAWNVMVDLIAKAKPEWKPGHFAAYHPVAYSWLIGGIVDRVMKLKKIDWGMEASSVSYLVHTMVAKPLGIPMDEVFVGCIPANMESSIARIETPPCPTPQLRRTSTAAVGQGSVSGSVWRWLEVNIAGPVEAWAVSGVLNLPLWRRLCLPSSNGAMTTRAVGRIYGALANNGQLPRSTSGGASGEFASAASVKALAARVYESATEGVALPCKHPDGDHGHVRARMSCGFFPWACPDLHGQGGVCGRVLNHEGMGGCMAYADPEHQLSIVVLKNVYEPLTVIGGSVSPDVCEITKEVRTAFGIQ